MISNFFHLVEWCCSLSIAFPISAILLLTCCSRFVRGALVILSDPSAFLLFHFLWCLVEITRLFDKSSPFSYCRIDFTLCLQILLILLPLLVLFPAFIAGIFLVIFSFVDAFVIFHKLWSSVVCCVSLFSNPRFCICLSPRWWVCFIMSYSVHAERNSSSFFSSLVVFVNMMTSWNCSGLTRTCYCFVYFSFFDVVDLKVAYLNFLSEISPIGYFDWLLLC